MLSRHSRELFHYQGGPCGQRVVNWRIYTTFYTDGNYGMASAMAVILMIVIMIVSLVNFKLFGSDVGTKRVNDEGTGTCNAEQRSIVTFGYRAPAEWIAVGLPNIDCVGCPVGNAHLFHVYALISRTRQIPGCA